VDEDIANSGQTVPYTMFFFGFSLCTGGQVDKWISNMDISFLFKSSCVSFPLYYTVTSLGADIQRQGSILARIVILSVYGADTIAIDLSVFYPDLSISEINYLLGF
jgi:hypothetical protein